MTREEAMDFVATMLVHSDGGAESQQLSELYDYVKDSIPTPKVEVVEMGVDWVPTLNGKPLDKFTFRDSADFDANLRTALGIDNNNQQEAK